LDALQLALKLANKLPAILQKGLARALEDAAELGQRAL
jgi:hypothetical protein